MLYAFVRHFLFPIVILELFSSFSNEDKYLKIHYDMDVLPEDRSLLPKFNSDVCKWHLFFSNLTEDVYQVVNDTFTMDYKRELRFQQTAEENEGASNQPNIPAIPETDAVIKGPFLISYSSFSIPVLFLIIFFSLLKGVYQKLSARAKGTTVRQVLSGTVFLNFHHLHPEFQKFILFRLQTVYKSKKEVQANVTFFLIMSVSASSPKHTIYAYKWCFLSFLILQQFLCSTMSVFWGLGVNCLIEHFNLDIEKIVHAFYPLFKIWVQQDYHNLKKLSDLSISIRR